MSSVVSSVSEPRAGRRLRLFAYPFVLPARMIRHRPILATVSALFVAAAAAFAVREYARSKWRAAEAALAAGNPKEAYARLAVPLAVWRWDPTVQVVAGRAARMAGELRTAEAHLNRSLKLSGGATEAAQLEFFLLRIQTGEVDRVVGPLIDAVEKGHPESELILETLSIAYINTLRYKPAYACLTRWIEIAPDTAKAYQYRGWVLERLSQPKDAAVDYRKVLELDPASIPVRLRVAEMLLEDHNPPEALPHLEQLYARVPDNPLVQARLGMCRFLQGDMAEARRLMEAAEPNLPMDPVLAIHLAKLDLQEGRWAEAERRLRKVVDNDPSDSEAFYTLITAVRGQGRNGEAEALVKEYDRASAAIDRINKFLKDVADSPTATADDFAEIGELLVSIKQDQRGLHWLHKALDRDPDHQRTHRALAAYYEGKGDAAKAASHVFRLRDPQPIGGAAAPTSTRGHGE